MHGITTSISSKNVENNFVCCQNPVKLKSLYMALIGHINGSNTDTMCHIISSCSFANITIENAGCY